MDSIVVRGGQPLNGVIPIAGAKNACLTLMPATLLSEDPLTLTNAPRLSDIKTMTELLRSLGAEVTALQNGKLAGASFDSFDKEPLRRWSPLWKTRNLLITPHISGITDDYQQRVGDLICENVRRFSAGDELLSLVDLDKGY